MPNWLAKRASSARGGGRRAGLQGNLTQKLRLWSGLILMAFAASHLANHSIGLVSLEAMEAVRLWFTGFWRSLPMSTVMMAALVAHIVLAIAKLAAGKTWRLNWRASVSRAEPC